MRKHVWKIMLGAKFKPDILRKIMTQESKNFDQNLDGIAQEIVEK